MRHGPFPPGCIGSALFAALLGTQVVLSGVLASLARPAVSGNRRTEAGIPRRFGHRLCLSPGNCPPATGLTLPDPAHGWLGLERGRRLVLAVTPGAALAGGVLLPTAASADHGLILTRLVPAKPPGRCGGIVAGQAALALARRIRLRRSAERSSSFKPPHVPYFSGLLTA